LTLLRFVLNIQKEEGEGWQMREWQGEKKIGLNDKKGRKLTDRSTFSTQPRQSAKKGQ
jgi:hypothetical protein